MADNLLFPRLHQLGVKRLIGDPARLRSDLPFERLQEFEEFISYAGSGGRRITLAELRHRRNQMLEVAAAFGFPGPSTQAQRAVFDARCAAWLIENEVVPGGEALRNDVWAFVTTCLLPDVSMWRFGDATAERFQGGVRNTFQRLWMRGRALDRGEGHDARWALLNALTEDALVGITERPSIGADPILARAIAEAWVETAAEVGSGVMEDVARKAVRNIRLVSEVVYLAALGEAQARAIATAQFRSAAVALASKA